MTALEKLRELETKATRGEWREDYDNEQILAGRRAIAEQVRQDPDRTLIVAMRNALPALLDALGAADILVNPSGGWDLEVLTNAAIAYGVARTKLDSIP